MQLGVERRIVVAPTTMVNHVRIEHKLSQDHAPESLPPVDLDSVPPPDEDPPVLVPGHVAGMEPGLVDPRDRHCHGVERSQEAFAGINWRQDVIFDDPQILGRRLRPHPVVDPRHRHLHTLADSWAWESPMRQEYGPTNAL